MTFGDWLAMIDWGGLIRDVAIPVAAILVSTVIAIRLARNERENARASQLEQRRLEAGSDVIVALVPLASLRATEQPMQERLWELRAPIAVYRAWRSHRSLSRSLAGPGMGRAGRSSWTTRAVWGGNPWGVGHCGLPPPLLKPRKESRRARVRESPLRVHRLTAWPG